MKEERITKRLTMYEEGTVSAYEVALAFLTDLTFDTDLDTAFVRLVPSLPHEIRAEFVALLRKIEQAGFHWKPPMIGPPNSPSERPGQAERLRQICSLAAGSGMTLERPEV